MCRKIQLLGEKKEQARRCFHGRTHVADLTLGKKKPYDVPGNNGREKSPPRRKKKRADEKEGGSLSVKRQRRKKKEELGGKRRDPLTAEKKHG